MKKITALIILDGLGYSEIIKGNAAIAANPHVLNGLLAHYPHTLLAASGIPVGLGDGEMGNSETGHLNIGGGRIIRQSVDRINAAISDGSFFENEAFLGAIENCKKHGTKLHLMGLCSDGGIHSEQHHLYALLELAKKNGFLDVYVHCFTDGRDKAVDTGIGYIRELEEKITELGCGKIATVSGRAYAMDRDDNFDNIQPAYDAMVHGVGRCGASATQIVSDSYAAGVFDEFIVPSIVTEGGKPVATIAENDSIICFNYRSDRMRELASTFVCSDSEIAAKKVELDAKGKVSIIRKNGFFPVYVASMTPYDSSINDRLHIAFENLHYDNVFGDYISKLGYTQIRIAETQKFAHVTRFFNALVEKPYPGEDRILVPSLSGAPETVFAEHPEMSAREVALCAADAVYSGKYDVMILNFANPDMVGHTGSFDAAVAAVKTVDLCLSYVLQAIRECGGCALVTADHGNCDEMIDHKTETVSTYHSLAPVPFILVDESRLDAKLRSGGALCDIAPTMLELMGEAIPAEMTGKSLIEK